MTNRKKNKEAKRPTHRAFSVRESNKEGGKGFWTAIGAAWANEDGKGFNISLDLVPLNGKIVLRLIEDKDQEGDDE